MEAQIGVRHHVRTTLVRFLSVVVALKGIRVLRSIIAQCNVMPTVGVSIFTAGRTESEPSDESLGGDETIVREAPSWAPASET